MFSEKMTVFSTSLTSRKNEKRTLYFYLCAVTNKL